MKSIAIALKDLKSSFRSTFAVVFMFAVPLLVTGMFYLMFGDMEADQEANLPATHVMIANQDAGQADFRSAAGQFFNAFTAGSLGDVIVQVLQMPEFHKLITVTLAADAQAALNAVDAQQAGVAVIIPASFTAQFMSPDGQAVLEIYSDPTLSVGPAIVQSILEQLINEISGARITAQVAAQVTGNPGSINQVMQVYMASQAQGAAEATLIDVHTPQAEKQPANLMLTIIGPVMGGMMIFYAFYTGTTTAQTILREEENHTLQRLFTTPTPQATILGGKFLAVFLTVLVQMVVLLLASHLIFRISWGVLPAVLLMAGAVILSASSFGIFVNSLIRDTKQGGILYGGVLTLTGMLGMLPIFTSFGSSGATWAEQVSLLVPQGWAVHAMYQSLNAVAPENIAVTALGSLAWSAVFLVIGIRRFQRRYV